MMPWHTGPNAYFDAPYLPSRERRVSLAPKERRSRESYPCPRHALPRTAATVHTGRPKRGRR